MADGSGCCVDTSQGDACDDFHRMRSTSQHVYREGSIRGESTRNEFQRKQSRDPCRCGDLKDSEVSRCIRPQPTSGMSLLIAGVDNTASV